jgi:hypothetical protein
MVNAELSCSHGNSKAETFNGLSAVITLTNLAQGPTRFFDLSGPDIAATWLLLNPYKKGLAGTTLSRQDEVASSPLQLYLRSTCCSSNLEWQELPLPVRSKLLAFYGSVRWTRSPALTTAPSSRSCSITMLYGPDV